MGRLLVFMGPPGAGKGSLSQQCLQRYGWKQLSTGALCRKHIAEQTDIGRQIDFAIQSGKLISDDLMVSMVQDWLLAHAQSDQSIVLDGFPRTMKQAELLSRLLKDKLSHCQLTVIRLIVPDKVVTYRLGGRAVCSNKECQAVYSVYAQSGLTPKLAMRCDACSGLLIRRSDDELESIRERLRVYHASTGPLIDFYRALGVTVHDIDVDRQPEQIFQDFDRMIGSGVYDHHKK